MTTHNLVKDALARQAFKEIVEEIRNLKAEVKRLNRELSLKKTK